MIVSNKYTKIERNGMYYIIPSSAPECPHCGGAMTVRDSKRRKLILSDGTVQMFVLRRYKCKICGRIHLHLPDIMLPHKHYAREAIIETVRGERNCSAESSRRSTAGTGRNCSWNVRCFRWRRKPKRRAGRKVSLAAGARAIKITGKMKKRQVRCLQLCDQ